jgi:hypothetical protein
MFFRFPPDTRWNPDRNTVEFGIGVGEYEGVVNAGEKMYQRAGVKLHHVGMPNAPTGRLRCATNRMRSVLPHRRMFPRRRALPHQACSR